MTDLLTWSFNLGRWSGVQVRLHFFLVFFLISRLLGAALADGHPVLATACWLSLLLLALLIHELGHIAVAAWQNVEPDDVRLWPLGNFVAPTGVARVSENFPVAAAGVDTSGVVAVVTAIALNFAGARMQFSPFGFTPALNAPPAIDTGSPLLIGLNRQAGALTPLWWLGWFGYLNWVLFLANLIPALPLDGGRMLRAALARSPVGLARDNLIGPWTARSFAALLTIAGLVRMISTGTLGDGSTLIVLAVLIELVVRTESRMLEDGGFFEDGVFGYDFSEGYTSLEGSAAKVRPYRESALKRWRRRRSELRKQRRQAREAAEDRRMDEILEKLHGHGKAALTEEEHRFLVRVSTKLRNRPKARE